MKELAQLSKAELYQRIRSTSRDEVILQGMIESGFWPKEKEQPVLAEELIHRRAHLQKEYKTLLAKKLRYENKELMLAELRKKRMQASRERQLETKKRKAEAKIELAKKWLEAKNHQILFLGHGISAGLNDRKSSETKLKERGLPVLHNEKDLAKELGHSVHELRKLLMQREVETFPRYRSFAIPKKSGGSRLISSPKKKLKNIQYWVLQEIIGPLQVSEQAHGFVANKSILSNAAPHVQKALVVSVDLKDFFPSINQKRIKGYFHSLGYSENIATILSLICCEPDRKLLAIEGKEFWIQSGPSHLPQGAPTSPQLSNLIAWKLDQRLQGLAKKRGFVYTRYADDLTFSHSGIEKNQIGNFLGALRRIISEEGFRVHPKKVHVLHRGKRQAVTGITVNEKTGVPREQKRKFRALVHKINKSAGPEIAELHWNSCQGTSPKFYSVVRGYAQFIASVEPAIGDDFIQTIEANKEKFPKADQATQSMKANRCFVKAHPEEALRWQETEKETPKQTAQPVQKTQASERPIKEKKPFWKKLLFWLD